MAESIREVRERFAAQLKTNGIPEAARKADLYLSSLLQLPLLELRFNAQPFPAERQARADTDLQRLTAHEPLQYVVGETAFRELDMHCDERALIPRAETEQLIDHIPDAPWKHIVDVGTGTGCIALAAARRFPAARVSAVDISPAALELAQSNAAKNGISSIQWRQGHLLDGFPAQRVDLLLANLPYISTDEMHVLPPDVLRYEPHLALHSGDTGMELTEELLRQARSVLESSGRFLLEIGELQGDSLASFAQQLGYADVQLHNDLAGKTRFISGMNHG